MFRRRGKERDRIILFGRYPAPGRVKTRLIPALGPAGAAALQKRFTEKTLETARVLGSHPDTGIEVCMEGGTEVQVHRWLGQDVRYSPQVSGDLGDRMRAAFSRAFQEGCRRVLLLGTDIPGLTPHILAQALQALIGHDLVLGPSRDGGYWLMGLGRPCELFCGIEWGTERVLDQTRAAAKNQELKVFTLEPLTDVDTVEDLKTALPRGFVPRPYLSVIIPVLNESGRIEAVIRRALHQDAEVIVADGGSHDDTVKRAVGTGARIVETSRGRAIQQNRGAALAAGEVFLFLHADTLLPRDYVNHVFETWMDPRTALGAFRFRTDLKGPLMHSVAFMTNIRSRWFHLPYGDQALFVRRARFEEIGGFPEVPIAEDLLLVRYLSKGGRVAIAPAEAVTSGRCWKRSGVFRTTLINQIILLGCLLGIRPRTLAPLHRVLRRRETMET